MDVVGHSEVTPERNTSVPTTSVIVQKAYQDFVKKIQHAKTPQVRHHPAHGGQ